MIRVGLHTFGFARTHRLEQTLQPISEAGFRLVQVMASPPHFDPWATDPERTRSIRTLVERYEIDLLAADLASNDVNLASTSVDVVRFSKDAYLKTLSRCEELGIRSICVGSGRRHALFRVSDPDLIGVYRSALAEIVDAADRLDMRVILENHPLGLLPDAASIQSFLAEPGFGQVGVVYDIANALAIGEDPVSGLALLGTTVTAIHLSDTKLRRWNHDPVGQGDINFPALKNHLERSRYEGSLIVEIISDQPLKDAVASIDRLNAMGWMIELQAGERRIDFDGLLEKPEVLPG